MPATAKLLATIASLPHGAVVLPGLDTDLDDDAWEPDRRQRRATPPASGHPQFAMHALLRRIGDRARRRRPCSAQASRGASGSSPRRCGPPHATERWARAHRRRRRATTALANVAVIEAANAEEEALAIAVALREAVHDGKTAALVTPDRALARRVTRGARALEHRGRRFRRRCAARHRGRRVRAAGGGSRARRAAAGQAARAAQACALPPRRRGGRACRAPIAALELAILRGPRPRPGTRRASRMRSRRSARRDAASLRSARQTERRRPRRRAGADRRARQRRWRRWKSVKRAQSFAGIAALHAQALRALSRDDRGVGLAFAGDDGEALAEAFDEIAEQRDDLRVAPGDYPDLFETAIADRTCRRAGRPGARVRILGPLEARLVSVDRVVLGGLVEGVWPPETRSDPWLSRARCGSSSGSICPSGASACRRTTSRRLLGAPRGHPDPRREARRRADGRVALHAAARGGRGRDALERCARAAARNISPGRATSIMPTNGQGRPSARAPRPPLDARPTQLSVTEIEHWLRDPYTIYAKHILQAASARRRRHAARRARPRHRDPRRDRRLHRDLRQGAAAPIRSRELLALGEKHFAPLAGFSRGARVLVAALPAHRALVRRTGRRSGAPTLPALHAEVRAALDIADRQARLHADARAPTASSSCATARYAILDYKTGAPPTEPQVRTGLSPQLTLEGAILRAGRLRGHSGGRIDRASSPMCRCAAASRRARRSRSTFKDGTPDAAADRALARLKEVIAKFEDPRRALSLAGAVRCGSTRYGDYDHLARVAEWSLPAAEDDGGRANEQRAIPTSSSTSSTPRPIRPRRPGSSANAGSGKTHVLAQRVIRLLLDGTPTGEDPLPHLHQGRRRQHGEPRVRDARATGRRSTTRRSTPRSPAIEGAQAGRASGARARGGCSRRRWRRRAG